MKKALYLFVLTIVLFSCTKKEESSRENLDLLAVTEVTFPTVFQENVVTEIPVKFALPNGCFRFYDFYYRKNDNTRTVAIVAVNSNQDACTQAIVSETQILKFKPVLAGTYTFKFYKGKDANGVDEFFEYEAIVN